MWTSDLPSMAKRLSMMDGTVTVNSIDVASYVDGRARHFVARPAPYKFVGGTLMSAHNFLNTCVNGASEESIGMYAKNRWRWSGCLVETKIIQQSYGGLKGKYLLGPREREKKCQSPGGTDVNEVFVRSTPIPMSTGHKNRSKELLPTFESRHYSDR